MSDEPRWTVGFVGVGAIAATVAGAILDVPHDREVRVVLSPRSAARSADLAARFPQVSVAASNQEVVDAADVVFLGVLPAQVEEVCAALDFRSGQIVVGMPAGWPPPRLAPLVAPAATVCQLIPLPMMALGVGPVVLQPHVPEVEELLTGCGTLVVVGAGQDISVFSCASAIMSSFFAFQRTAIDWMVAQGIDRPTATAYVTSQLHGLTTESTLADLDTLADAVTEHETPGGLNEHIRRALEDGGLFAELARQLDVTYARVAR